MRQAKPRRGRPGGEYVGWEQARIVDVEVTDDGRGRREQVFGRLHRGKVLALCGERRHVAELGDVGVDALDFVGCFAEVTGGRGEPQIVVDTGSDSDRSGALLKRDRIAL
jgi:hypothetical protein